MNTMMKRLFEIKQSEHKDNDIFRMMLPSFIGIVVCAMCLVGLTFAWFTANVETVPQLIVASNWDAQIAISDGSDNVVTPTGDSTYSLSAGTEYTVTVTASGTGSGYCVLTVGGNDYHTAQIKNDAFTFTFTLPESAYISLAAYWGTYTGEADVNNGGKLEITITEAEIPDTSDSEGTPDSESSSEGDDSTAEPSPDTTTTPDTYTVQKGDTLGGIAAMFGTTTAKLAAYNGIDDPNRIEVGQVLQIPPEDYEIPEETSKPEETETVATETTAPAPETTAPETTAPVPETTETTPSETSAPETEPQPEETTGPCETEPTEPETTEPDEVTEP